MTNEYYKYLYVDNVRWNTIEPNRDERDRWKAIKPLVDSLGRKDLSIIDVGCGRGVFSNLLSEYGDVVGTEPAHSVVDYGRVLYPNLQLHSLSLEDYVHIFPDKKYDLILCTEVLEHVVDKSGFINRLKGLVKDNGFVILTTPRKEKQEEWVKMFGNPKQPIEEWISTDELISLIDQSGLKRLDYKTASIFGVYQVHLLSV